MRARLLAVSLVALMASGAPYAQAPAPASPSIVGAWTLNKDLSDQPRGGDEEGREGREGRRGGGYGGGGRRGGGGFGGGGFGGQGRGGTGETRSPEEIQRLRNALRDELRAAQHLTITDSGSTVIMTADDGRTTRLSTDGKKIKDESTNVERKTKRDGGKIVSEISGLGQGKITETYSVDPEHNQLHMTLDIEGRQGKTTVKRVYDADAAAR
jgi:hypothetical protein